MMVTEHTRNALNVRREVRDMTRAGYERVGECGGRLWEIYRGDRMGQIILDARIATGGRSLWVKIGTPEQGG